LRHRIPRGPGDRLARPGECFEVCQTALLADGGIAGLLESRTRRPVSSGPASATEGKRFQLRALVTAPEQHVSRSETEQRRLVFGEAAAEKLTRRQLRPV